MVMTRVVGSPGLSATCKYLCGRYAREDVREGFPTSKWTEGQLGGMREQIPDV